MQAFMLGYLVTGFTIDMFKLAFRIIKGLILLSVYLIKAVANGVIFVVRVAIAFAQPTPPSRHR